MRSFIVLLCLVPTLLLAQQSKLETQLKQAIKDKKAEIGIANQKIRFKAGYLQSATG